MKKLLFMLAAAALVLVGCEKEEVVEVSSITVDSEAALILGGEDYVLSVNAAPSNAQFDKSLLSFVSSDESVVIVSAEGILSAVAKGNATVTVSYKTLTAICEVVVVEDELELLTWGDMYLVGLGNEPLFADTLELTDSEGIVEKCQLYLGQWFLADANIGTDDEGQFLGGGYVAECMTPVFVIAEGEYAGYYLSPRKGFAVAGSLQEGLMSVLSVTKTSDLVYPIFPQTIADSIGYATFIDKGLFLGEVGQDGPEAEAYLASMPFGNVFEINFDEQTQYFPTGLLGVGTFVDNTNYDFTINWFDGLYGLDIIPAENEYGFDILRPYSFLEPFVVAYTAGQAAPAPARAAKKLNAQKIQYKSAMVNVK